MPRQSIHARALVAATLAVLVAIVSACGIKGPLRPAPKTTPATATPPATANPATPPATTSPALPPPSSPPPK
ncbi:MAG TPA: lipoprotein [Casimicrobiaceae bacterium]|nr:lipoprotein [Casimicrobiaceae bacterium]